MGRLKRKMRTMYEWLLAPERVMTEDAVHPRQDDVGRHLADDVGIMMDAGAPA
jgi:hypothetical protein